MKMRRLQRRTKQSGVTLLELLVVASIMLTLAAVSVPTIKPMMEAQQTSNAASAVSTYLNRARARAVTTGRPCGVMFEQFSGSSIDHDGDGTNDDGSVCLVLRQVEVPPYYTGLDYDTFVTVDSSNDGYLNGTIVRQVQYSDPYWGTFVSNENNASIQFDNTGPFYPLVFDGGYSYIERLPGLELPSRLRVPFKVMRDPRPTMTAPIGLPSGTVVDLEWSGCGESESDLFSLGTSNSGDERNNNVIVMFAPSGEVEYVEDWNGRVEPTETLYFLVGRWDRATILNLDLDAADYYYDEYGEPVTLEDDGLWNYEDGTNFWVTINPQTGLVSTVPVNPPTTYTGTGSQVIWQKIEESREFARESKRNLGGR